MDDARQGSGGFDQDALETGALVQPDRVHRRLFTDPAIFDLEMRRVMEEGWVFIGHDSEVPHHGDYRLRWIGRQPAILVRHSDGAAKVLMNHCMHRGTTLCRAEAGNAPELECPYHGWRYDTAGRLLSVAYPDGYGDDFDRAALSLVQPARVANYRGFVFASLNPASSPVEEYLGLARRLLDQICDAAPDGRIAVGGGTMKYDFAGNWKLQIENWMDNYHPNFTHRTAFEARAGLLRPRRRLPGRIHALPGGHGFADYSGERPGLGSDKPDYDGYVRRMKQSHGEERARRIMEFDIQLLIFPNLFFQPSNNHFRIVRPVAVDRTEITVLPYHLAGAPDSFNDALIRATPWWASAGGFGQPDDMETLERCQIGYQVRDAQWSLISRGLQREERRADGSVVGEMADEVIQRGIYREWRRRMTELG